MERVSLLYYPFLKGHCEKEAYVTGEHTLALHSSELSWVSAQTATLLGMRSGER